MNRIFEQPMLTIERHELDSPDRRGEITRIVGELSVQCGFDFKLDIPGAEASGMLAVIEQRD